MLKSKILLAVLLSYSLCEASVEVLGKWVLPRGDSKIFELLPHERTRPIIVGDIVYTASLEGKVKAVHRLQGNVLWEVKLPGLKASVDGSLAYGRSKLIVGDTQGNLYALNARDGSINWKFTGTSEWLAPAVVSRDKVFAMTSSDELYAFGENDGKEKWHYARKGDEKMTIRGTASPAVFGNEVFQGFSDGYLVALNATDGKVFWSKRLRMRDRFYDVDATPVVDEHQVIAATYDGTTQALDRTTGNVNWVFRAGSYGSFLMEDDKIYFAGLNGFFYCMNKVSGTVVWKTAVPEGVGLTPARSGEYLVVTSSSDPFYLIDPHDGEIVNRKRLGAGTLASAMGHADGSFYILSNYGNLFAYDIFKDLFSDKKKGPETLTSPSALMHLAQSKGNTTTL